jgi:hypothetical protein
MVWRAAECGFPLRPYQTIPAGPLRRSVVCSGSNHDQPCMSRGPHCLCRGQGRFRARARHGGGGRQRRRRRRSHRGPPAYAGCVRGCATALGLSLRHTASVLLLWLRVACRGLGASHRPCVAAHAALRACLYRWVCPFKRRWQSVHVHHDSLCLRQTVCDGVTACCAVNHMFDFFVHLASRLDKVHGEVRPYDCGHTRVCVRVPVPSQNHRHAPLGAATASPGLTRSPEAAACVPALRWSARGRRTCRPRKREGTTPTPLPPLAPCTTCRRMVRAVRAQLPRARSRITRSSGHAVQGAPSAVPRKTGPACSAVRSGGPRAWHLHALAARVAHQASDGPPFAGQATSVPLHALAAHVICAVLRTSVASSVPLQA